MSSGTVPLGEGGAYDRVRGRPIPFPRFGTASLDIPRDLFGDSFDLCVILSAESLEEVEGGRP